MHYLNNSISITLRYFSSILIIAIIAISSGNILAQTAPKYAAYETFPILETDTIQSISIDSIQNKPLDNIVVEAPKDFEFRLVQINQYMQSVQLIFEFKNSTTDIVNNFWLHISLLSHNKGFLYREQPTLFSSIGPGRSQSFEILCESVGIEEVGFVVLHPKLLEINRDEIEFDTKKVLLIQAQNTNAKMIFNNDLR